MKKAVVFTLILWMSAGAYAGGVHITYLWHMHQPIYWPEVSVWNPARYQMAYESMHWKWNGGNIYPGSSGSHPYNNLEEIFNNDDRVADYQYYPRNTLAALGDLPDSGAHVSFAAALIENLQSLSDAGWGRYGGAWYAGYQEAASWTTSGGHPRLELVGVGAHHAVNALLDPEAFRMELRVHKAARDWRWPTIQDSVGFFPAETCFSERMIQVLVEEGYEWTFVPSIHISRACSDYPYGANGDNIDPPNSADQINGPGGTYFQLTIPRGVTTRDAVPMAFKPHWIEYVDPATGTPYRMIGVPTAQGMSWNEGYGSYGFGEIDQVAWASTPDDPLLIVFAHDGDNAYAGGYSYYNENVPSFAHQAAGLGHHMTTVDQFLDSFTPSANDIVHVEDGGWVNADGDFGSPQYINWNWPLVGSDGEFDIPGGWAEDERNWAVITAAHAYVETADQIAGPARPLQVYRPEEGANALEQAWHFYLGALDSGYMYYGASIDMEVKATLGCNQAVALAEGIIGGGGQDATGPAIWLPQRLPWNPGGMGMGSLWRYQYIEMPSDFYVWTFVHDPSGVARVSLFVRVDDDGENPLNTHVNETYAGGAGVGAWQEMAMNYRDFPADNLFGNPEIDLFVLPDQIADEYWIEVTGFEHVLLDYFVEAEDARGNIKRSPIQHVYIGEGGGGPQTGVTWEPEHPTFLDVIRITTHDPGQGGWLHWGVNASGHTWQTPHESYWPEGSYLFNGTGPAVETPFLGPDEDGDYWVDLGPFNNPEQVVSTVDFVIHYADNTWDNNGGSDYHIEISPYTPTPAPPTATPTSTPSGSPSATRTPAPGTPTATPSGPPTATPAGTVTATPTPFLTPTPQGTPSATPTPAYSPSATPTLPAGGVWLELPLNYPWFTGGDQLILWRRIGNTGAVSVDCQQWIALEVYGQFFFHPMWNSQPNYTLMTIAPGARDEQVLLQVRLPQELGRGGPFNFYGVLLDPANGALMTPLVRSMFGFY